MGNRVTKYFACGATTVDRVGDVGREQKRYLRLYRVWCETEREWIYGLGSARPRVCYNSSAHTIKYTSSQVVHVYEVSTSDELRARRDTGFVMQTISEVSSDSSSPENEARRV